MAELIDVANAMFKNKREWVNITEDEKIKFFFIFNRYFSKRYPQLSYCLNNKYTNKSVAMDIWFNYMIDKPYPKWFWSKSEKIKLDTGSISEKDFILLYEKLQINKQEDLIYLIDKFPELIKDELKFYKALEKQN